MSSGTTARAKEFSSAFGWPAAIDTSGVVTVRDPNGRVRATYQGSASKHPDTALAKGDTHTVSLPEGDVVLHNGARNAFRRREHNGHLDLHGRRYEFRHRRRWNTEIWCGGVRVAVLHRRSSQRFTVRANALRDDVDLLATVLCWYAVRPGRAGAISSMFDGL